MSTPSLVNTIAAQGAGPSSSASSTAPRSQAVAMMHAQAQHQAAAPASTCVVFLCFFCVLYAIDAAPVTLSASHELSRTALHAVAAIGVARPPALHAVDETPATSPRRVDGSLLCRVCARHRMSSRGRSTPSMRVDR